MTAKEKAKHIYNKMLEWQTDAHRFKEMDIVSITAKKCSVVCVNEIISLIKEEQHEKFQKELIDYWDKVIVQIESIT